MTEKLKEKTLKTRCGDIHYWISDSIDNRKPTLLFLPGLTADHRLFDKQIEFFENKCNVLVWDAPAHASSWPFSFDFNLQDKARWVNEIIDSEKIEKPIIVGQSMGGYVGQMFCELFPDKLKGFVSIDSAPLQRKFVTSFEIWLLKRMEPIYRSYPWKRMLKDGSRGVAETEYGINLMREIMMVYDKDRKRYAKLVGHGYKILADAMETDRAYEVKCPFILICGEKDKAGSCIRYNKAWEKEIGVPVHWVKNAGHNSNTDDPEYVNGIIETLLD